MTDDNDDNVLAGVSDGRLVTNAFNNAGGSDVEMMRRLKGAIKEADRTATRLSRRIVWLTVWLLVFTIAIFVLTGALFLAERHVWPFIPTGIQVEGV